MRARRRLRGLMRTSAYQRAWRSMERSIARRKLITTVELGGLEELRRRLVPDPSKIPDEAPWKYLQLAHEDSDGAGDGARRGGDERFDREILCSDPGPAGTKGWQLTYDLLRRIDEVSRGLGARFAVVTIPGLWQNDPSILEKHFEPVGLAQGQCDPLLPGRRVCELASSLGASCIDLLPEFWASGPSSRRYWKSDRHFTGSGHEAAARLLATFLRTERLIPETKGEMVGPG